MNARIPLNLSLNPEARLRHFVSAAGSPASVIR
jgi:hypothetical protein